MKRNRDKTEKRRRGAPLWPRQPNSLGDHVTRLRKTRGYTQKQLADLAGIVLSTLSQIENGHTTKLKKQTVEKLCKALKIRPCDLLLGNSQWLFIEKEAIPLSWLVEPTYGFGLKNK